MLITKIETASEQIDVRCLRLILGDQLNAQHHWFKNKDPSVLYVVAEVLEETNYVKHHVQKVCAFFSAMQHFANALDNAGHNVLYLTLDETSQYSNMAELIKAVCLQTGPDVFEYQEPEELRLVKSLDSMPLNCDKKSYSAEHFFLDRSEFDSYVKPGRHNRLEIFYRKLRKRFDILMSGETPEGGTWNFDAENRSSLRKNDLSLIPEPLVFSNDVRDILRRLQAHHVKTIGKQEPDLLWPVNRQQSQQLLEYFCTNCLPYFGRYQDAMTGKVEQKWSLFHSRLSFSLNAKILSPKQVIDAALKAYRASNGNISLPQIEGFVRQILGWREYIRAVYWQNAENYCKQNILSANGNLPDYFWHGKTKMRCISMAVGQSLDKAYAHHIQRLMITGNFCLLTGIDPSQVEEWYLGIYIDAIEWVEQPNTRGMSQWADGGWVATKPYCAGGNYINKMSDYCKSCHYNVKEKVGKNACPFNSLYWNFIERHADKFKKNPRMAMIYRNWDKQNEEEKTKVLARAKSCLMDLNEL